MVGIVLAGGKGTRQYPATKALNKHLLMVYNKPLIYYPISILMLAGIHDIVIVTNQEDIPSFYSLLGNGSAFGVKFSYVVQEAPLGIAHALKKVEEYVPKGRCVAVILGDNIFYGHGLPALLNEAIAECHYGKAVVFGYRVKDPERFGVVEFDDNGNVISIEEKPEKPKSDFAVTGLYFYPYDVFRIIDRLSPSKRGEYEITDVNKYYLKDRRLVVKLLGRGYAWFDAGTCDSFLEAGNFVRTIENRTGTLIGSVEEIAYNNGWISKAQLLKIAVEYPNGYGKYLKNL